MKKIAILTAAGSGKRMGQDIPKQFINVNDKPVIIYTMEAFQRHPNVDAIIVVCKDGWHEILKAYAKQFNISKLVAIVNGGENGQDSIRNGLIKAKELFDDSDLVIIHDGTRPMVSEEIISDNIAKCMTYGNATAAIPCAEAMLETDNHIDSTSQISRDNLKRTQTPQTFPLGELFAAHQEALARGIINSVASCTLYIELGKKVYFANGSEKNLKLTTPDDMEIFKALLNVKKDEWFK